MNATDLLNIQNAVTSNFVPRNYKEKKVNVIYYSF